MRATLDEQERLELKLEEDGWPVSGGLFGDTGGDINDFEIYNYTHFLDNVKSLGGLLEGLHQLSPFVDDALKVVEHMNHQDFYEFKIALAYERIQEDSKMPERYLALLIPQWFMYAIPISEKCKVPLGATLIRFMESKVDL